MAIGKFRRGQSTYTCNVCKKLTRNTGDEGSCGLCRDCFDLASIDNTLTDDGEEAVQGYYGNEVRAILARRPELKEKFGDLAKAVGVS